MDHLLDLIGALIASHDTTAASLEPCAAGISADG